MRTMFLKEKFAAFGAEFTEINGAQAIKSAASFEAEYDAIRKTAALSDFSFTRRFVFDEQDGLDFLDTLLAQNILKLRYGKISDTFLATPEGDVAAECFVANIDDKVYLIVESIADDAFISDTFLNGCASAREITNDTALLTIDGPEAWRVAKDICGGDVLSLTYLSIEKYSFGGDEILMMRNGKTGEFGYQIIAPLSVAEKLFDSAKESLDTFGGAICGVDALFNARLEGNFFNVYAEGATVKNPILLGIQWMIDLEKDAFIGSEKILARRNEACPQTLVGIKALERNTELAVGASVFAGDECVAKIVAVGFSKILNAPLALALFDKKWGLSGFEYSLSSKEKVETISMPPIIALSLQNGLDS